MNHDNVKRISLGKPPQKLEGELEIPDQEQSLAVRSFIYRGDSIAFEMKTNVYGANQMISVDGVALRDGEIFKSGLIAPKQAGSDGKDLYRVQITIRCAVPVSKEVARIEGSWALVKIHGNEPFEIYEFEGELSFV